MSGENKVRQKTTETTPPLFVVAAWLSGFLVVGEVIILIALLSDHSCSATRCWEFIKYLEAMVLLPVALLWVFLSFVVSFLVGKGASAQIRTIAAVLIALAPTLTYLPKVFDDHSDRWLKQDAPTLAGVDLDAPFSCVHEKSADSMKDTEAGQLYLYAMWLKDHYPDRSEWRDDPRVERPIRIAAAHGHDLATVELRRLIYKGIVKSDNQIAERLGLAEELLKRGGPEGYDSIIAFLPDDYQLRDRYRRRAADLGHPYSQFDIGTSFLSDYLNDAAKQTIGSQMLLCAVEQGFAAAGYHLGNWLKENKKFPEALQAYQMAAKAGDADSALILMNAFSQGEKAEKPYNLGLPIDQERANRYRAIAHLLGDIHLPDPKVPEIDSIVPLPPAKLPRWNGAFQWLKTHEANVPPPLPSEERIREMAKEKNLDPETGRPLQMKKADATPEPAPQAAAPKLPLAAVVASLQRCPQTGLWECAAALAAGEKRRFYTEGMTLPASSSAAPSAPCCKRSKASRASADRRQKRSA